MSSNTISKILVPIDFSDSSMNALETAIAMALRQGAEIELLNVIESNRNFGIENVHLNDVLAISGSLLETLIESVVKNNSVKCTFQVQIGSIDESICSYATTVSADIIVMGAHGASGLREFFIGSNAYSIIKKAPCPVLTIPNNVRWLSFKKILFPVRPIEKAIDKYDFVRLLVKKNNAELIVLGFKNTHDSSDLKLIDSLIDELRIKLKKDEISAVINYYTGDNFKDAFWGYQERFSADLIVVTANIDNSFKNLFIGPFTQQIVNHAKVPVLSIKPYYGKIEFYPDHAQMAEWAVKYGSTDPFSSFPQ